jgi:hypothetical protein
MRVKTISWKIFYQSRCFRFIDQKQTRFGEKYQYWFYVLQYQFALLALIVEKVTKNKFPEAMER